MAGPNGPAGSSSGLKQTGTRPKSRGSQNSSFSSPGVQNQQQAFMMGIVGQHDNRQMVGQHDMASQRQEPNLANLMREHQTVSENLALLREQLGREAGGVVAGGNTGVASDTTRGVSNVNSQPRNQRQVDSELLNTKMQMVSKLAELEQRKLQMDRVLAVRGREAGSFRPRYGHSNGTEDVRAREVETLRSRLRELEDMVMVLDRPVENSLDAAHMLDTRNTVNEQFDFSHSFNNAEQNHSFGSLDTTPGTSSFLGMSSMGHPGAGMESDSQETLERSLALLTAQYEKTSHEDDRLDLSPGMLLDKAGDKSEHDMMPPAMVPLNNSESVRLARELRDKRDQLEQLMQKNVFTTNVNELSTPKHDIFNTSATSGHSSTLGRSKDTNRSHGVLGGGGPGYAGYAPHPHHGVRAHPVTTHTPDIAPTSYTDMSWVPGQVNPTSVQSNSTSQQLYRLQDQVTKLKGELDRLSLPQLPQSQPRPEEASPNQVAQLSASINQLYAGLWAMQRDVSNLTERMQVLETAGEGRPESRETIPSPNTVDDNTEQWPGNNVMNNNIWPGSSAVSGLAEQESWPGLGSTQQQQQPNPFPLWDQHQHFSPFPSRDLWNSLQASPGFSNPLHPAMGMFGPNFHISETDSGVSSGALNNKVSPGLRANNYYDNFRSFSRQNRLSGPPGPTPPLPANSRPTQRPQQAVSEAANNLPSLSNPSTRTRRKYKINREQNRDRGAEQSNVRRRTEGGDLRGANPVLAANTYTSPTSAPATTTGVDSLTKNIYSQVGALIQQNDRAPELLARLLQDLTLLGQQDRQREDVGTSFRSRNTAANMNLDTVDTSSYTSEETRDARHDQTRASARLSRSKVSGKRLTSGPQSVFPVLVSNSAFDPEQSSSDTALGPAAGQEGSVGGVGGDGWGQTAPVQPWNITPPQLEQASGVAVPKNQQKNLISRERDSRKMPGWRERLLPRNMQGGDGSNILADQSRFGRDVAVSMPGQDRAGVLPDQDGFVNIQLELPGDHHQHQHQHHQHQHQAQEGHNMSLHQSLSDMAEAELAEADQVHEAAEGEDGAQFRVEEHFLSPTHDHSSYHPEGVFPVRDSDSPLRPVNHQNQSLAGLDRVPIRLPSNCSNPWPGPLPSPTQMELDRLERRLVEEDAVASIVEEVLASSPELANNQGADLPPTP